MQTGEFAEINKYIGKNVENVFDKFHIMYPDCTIEKIHIRGKIEIICPNPRRIRLYYSDSKNILEIVVG
jgi:hypothetical protein